MHKYVKAEIKTAEFAKMCNTSKRTLQYYDEVGVFHPAFVDENGYRYYSEDQCDLFITIRTLAEIGTPLPCIKDYVSNKNLSDLKAMLLAQKEKIDMEMKKIAKAKAIIETKLSMLDKGLEIEANNQFHRVCIEHHPEEYMLLSRRLETNQHKELFDTLLGHIRFCVDNNLNIGNPYGAMVSTDDIKNGIFHRYSYCIIKVAQNSDVHDIHVKEEGNYAVVYLKGDYDNTEEAYNLLIDFFDENNLKMGEYVYREAVIDEMAEEKMENFITKISIGIIGM